MQVQEDVYVLTSLHCLAAQYKDMLQQTLSEGGYVGTSQDQ